MDIYQSILRPVLFNWLKADPEWLHNSTINSLNWINNNHQGGFTSSLRSYLQKNLTFHDSCLQQKLFGLNFSNPVGLAAGFDKNGSAAGIWSNFGFGFAELGTVTYRGQPGNPAPRMFRLPLDKAALNRMGFNNNGAAALAAHLSQETFREPLIPIGINLGKSKVTPLEEAPQDYLESFRLLKNLGDYFVVNVSSPNTPGLRSLQDASSLSEILQVLQDENNADKPIFVKISPDLELEAISEIIPLATTYKLAGIIATNTTISRDGLQTQVIAKTGLPPQEENGGISGYPVRDRATEVIRFIYQQTKGEIPIIGVGGIFTHQDAWAKITAGASLVQVYTGWVYQGPFMVRQILEGLKSKLEENNMDSISQAVGSQT